MTRIDERLPAARAALEGAVPGTPPELGTLLGWAARRRRRALAVVAVVALGTGGLAVAAGDDPPGARRVVAGPPTGPGDHRNADLLAPGQTRLLPPAPIAGRADPAAVWTGTELVVWGGGAGAATQFDDGAAYDPRADLWRLLAPGPLSARENPAAVWTGTEVLIWGGRAAGGAAADGAAYDPATDTWRTIAPAPIPGAIRPATVWTGREMLVVGGINAGPHTAAYNPAADAWREAADAPGGSLVPYPQAVWTGSHAVLALIPPFARDPNASLIASYDPAGDRWTELPPVAVRSPRLVMTGEGLVAVDAAEAGVSARYDAATGAWTAVATTPAAGFRAPVPVWTGTTVIGWAGAHTTLLRPGTGTWHADPAAGGGLAEREHPPTVWADGVVLTWGGFASGGPGGSSGLDDGLMYRPAGLPPTEPPAPPPTVTTSMG